MADGGATLANDLTDKFLGESLPPMDWIPDPDRYFLLITQVGIKRKSAGGILLPDASISDQQWNHGLGLVIKTGPAVYTGQRFRDMNLDVSHAPTVGDLVLFQARTPNRIEVQMPDGGWRLFLEIADDALLGRVKREHMHRIKFQVG